MEGGVAATAAAAEMEGGVAAEMEGGVAMGQQVVAGADTEVGVAAVGMGVAGVAAATRFGVTMVVVVVAVACV